MTHFRLNLNCENAAFQSDFETHPTDEIRRILKEVIKKLEAGEIYNTCFDINVNNVGEFYCH